MLNATPVENVQVELVPPAHMPRLRMLDGWRAISILAVLQCHLGSYGPGWYADFNAAFGILGMALFFGLSGFLITSTLYFNPSVRVFLIRRLARIVPAAWLFLLVALPMAPFAGKQATVANVLFFANLSPYYLFDHLAHLWSLGLEVQFYALVAVLFLCLRRKAFALLPVLAVGITVARILTHHTWSIRPEFRGDEILTGATLAFLFHNPNAHRVRALLAKIPPILPLVLLALSSSASTGLAVVEYGRPWFAALLLGSTLCRPEGRWARALSGPALAYVAAISYALYLWHPLLLWAWVYDVGDPRGFFTRMPLGLVWLWIVAHVSTYYLEKPCIRWGNGMAKRFDPKRTQAA